MTHWTDICTFDGLEQFQIDFREMSDEEKKIILTEMLAHIEMYKMRIEVIEHGKYDKHKGLDKSSDEPPLLRIKRRRGRTKSGVFRNR